MPVIPGVLSGGSLQFTPAALPPATRLLSVSAAGVQAYVDPATFESAGAAAAAVAAHVAAGDPHSQYLTQAEGDARYALLGSGVTDHGALTGLGDDDHSIYALLAGRAGGQTLIGGSGSGEHLTLRSTSHATKGNVVLGGGFSVNDAGDINCRSVITTTTIQSGGHLQAVLNGEFRFGTSRSKLKSPADSSLTLYNAAENNFNQLQLGGTTSSFPSLKRSGTEIHFRLADDSANCQIRATSLAAQDGSGTNIAGAALSLAGGRSTGNAAGGNIALQVSLPGSSGASLNTLVSKLTVRGADGLIVVDVPTSNPAVAGALWNDGGTLKVSAG